jgi:hypothetical protein
MAYGQGVVACADHNYPSGGRVLAYIRRPPPDTPGNAISKMALQTIAWRTHEDRPAS